MLDYETVTISLTVIEDPVQFNSVVKKNKDFFFGVKHVIGPFLLLPGCSFLNDLKWV